MNDLKEKYIQFCCDFYNEHAPEDKDWFGRMFDECAEEHNKRNSAMFRWQFPLMVLQNCQKEHDELLAFNEKLDRERNGYRKDARKYAKKIQMIADLLRSPTDKEMTLKAIKTVIDRVGEHG